MTDLMGLLENYERDNNLTSADLWEKYPVIRNGKAVVIERSLLTLTERQAISEAMNRLLEKQKREVRLMENETRVLRRSGRI